MTGELKIRIAEPNDYEEIIKLFNSWTPDNWDTEYAVRYYRDFFDNRHCCPLDEVFVGAVNGKVVGVTGYCPDIDETNGIYWLNWFYVHRAHRMHGYGEQLLDHVIEALKIKKTRKLYVDTTSYRFYKKAKALYEKKGFTHEGTLEDYYEKGEHQIIFGMRLKE